MAARLFAVLAIALAAPAALPAAQDFLTGTITYRERMALPPNAMAEVTLEDVSRADAPPTVVARARLEAIGQVPLRFDLPFDGERIDAGHRYGVRARILDGDRVLFATTQATLVLTQGHGDFADLVLSRMAPSTTAKGASTAASAAASAPLAPLPPAATLTGLPATFGGTLPCADCPGVKYQLNLFADDSYVLRRTYTGKSTTPLDEVGSWALSSDRRVLILKGAGDAELFAIRDNQTLRRLDMDGREIKSTQSIDLRRAPGLQPIDARGTFRGAYRATPDGATFTECASGQRWPVVSEGASADLETAYRAAKRRPGEALVVTIDGHATTHSRGDGAPAETTVVVDRVSSTSATDTCAARLAAAPLDGTYWRVTKLGDTAVPAAASTKNELYLTFQSDERFAGSSGCNRLIGTYAKSGDALVLTPAGTMKACATGLDTERALVTTLRQVQAYRILGDVLELQDGQRKPVARLQARPHK